MEQNWLFLFKLLTSCFFSEVRHSLLLIENTESFFEPKKCGTKSCELKIWSLFWVKNTHLHFWNIGINIYLDLYCMSAIKKILVFILVCGLLRICIIACLWLVFINKDPSRDKSLRRHCNQKSNVLNLYTKDECYRDII